MLIIIIQTHSFMSMHTCICGIMYIVQVSDISLARMLMRGPVCQCFEQKQALTLYFKSISFYKLTRIHQKCSIFQIFGTRVMNTQQNVMKYRTYEYSRILRKAFFKNHLTGVYKNQFLLSIQTSKFSPMIHLRIVWHPWRVL